MAYETIIGLEVHAQLSTRSKMFCRCSADYVNSPPNSHVCPVCLGMPGVLPVINRQAVEYAIATALALNCTIASFTKFDRKNYPYPDLMKGYQISQYDTPLSHDGWLEIEVDGRKKRIGIIRVHLEEDVAKLLHRNDPSGETYSLVDVNRAGVPLLEIVTRPDINSPEEAREFLIKLHRLLRWLGVSNANMEEGSFRCDANISVHDTETGRSSAKVELKNLNSFKAVYQALKYEAERQEELLRKGIPTRQETRGWDEAKGITVLQRSKEYAHDYRYFAEPDLPPLRISSELVEEIRSRLPELPDARCERFITQYGLPNYDANLLTSSRELADFFEECVRLSSKERAKTISNWILGDLLHLLNVTGTGISDSQVSPKGLNDLLELIERGVLSTTLAKKVLEEMFHTGKSASEVVAEQGLTQISESSELLPVVEKVLQENSKAVADYKKGKEQALKFLIGQVMRATRGRAKPELVANLLKEKLK